MITEHPIIFKGDMVRAILDGRKTQTRRVVKIPEGVNIYRSATELDLRLGRYPTGPMCGIPEEMVGEMEPNCSDMMPRCPYGQPGDTLWVRETWAVDACWDYHPPREIPSSVWTGVQYLDSAGFHGKARPSIFMPRWASRIDLRVTGVRLERVREITPRECKREGIEDKYQGPGKNGALCIDFRDLWDSINAKRGYSWDTNPWVWVIEFERVTVIVRPR